MMNIMWQTLHSDGEKKKQRNIDLYKFLKQI